VPINTENSNPQLDENLATRTKHFRVFTRQYSSNPASRVALKAGHALGGPAEWVPRQHLTGAVQRAHLSQCSGVLAALAGSGAFLLDGQKSLER
jgi:hypothetical protein